MAISDDQKIQRNGKIYVLYGGLLHEVHEKFKDLEVDTQLTQAPHEVNGNVAIVKAVFEGTTAIPEQRRIKTSGIGDACPDVVNGVRPGPAEKSAPIRMAECFSLDAQILTREGWKSHDALTVGEAVLAYDVDADMLRWVNLEAVNVFEDQPTVTWVGESFRFTGTPDHKWPVEKFGKRKFAPQRVLRPANEFKAGDRIVTGALAEGGEHPISERDAAVLGWLATDGSLRWHTVSDRYGTWGPYPRAYIQQSKPAYLEEIRDLLGEDAKERVDKPRAGGHRRGILATQPAHRFGIKTAYLKRLLGVAGFRNEADPWKALTPLVLNMSGAARLAFLNAALHGDGTSRAGGSGSWVFGKKRKPGVMEAVELAALLEGYSMGKPRFASVGKLSEDVPVPIRTFKVSRRTGTAYIETIPGPVQDVWCPTTPLGTCVVRQNGYISPSGQTRAKARAFRDAIDLADALMDDPTTESEEETRPAPVHPNAQRANRPPEGRRGVPPPRDPEPDTTSPETEPLPPASRHRDTTSPAGKGDKARASQVELLRTLAVEWAGDGGVERLEKRIGKSLANLTQVEADEWIDRLSPEGRE